MVVQAASLDTFAQSCAQVSTLAELWRLTYGYVSDRGVTMVSYHADQGQGPVLSPDQISAQGFPQDWVCHYIGAQLVDVDPIPDLAQRMGRPFFWSETATLTRLSDAEADFLRQLSEADIGDGLAFHVTGPNMRNAYVGLGFGHKEIDLAPSQIFELRCAAQIAHLRFCDLTFDRRMVETGLTPREREVLGWIAQGKSNAVIAQILGISRHTVDTLTRRIFEKLGVNDRITAAIQGIGSGLVRTSRARSAIGGR
ncbi:MAG: LuxR family transcriptional regulator [Pseudomonadota bacterium]